MSNSSARLHAAPVRAVLEPGGAAAIIESSIRQHAQTAYAAGYAQALSEAAGALSAGAEALETITEGRRNEDAHDAVTLAVAIAEKLLRTEIDAGRYDLERIVRETLAAAAVQRGVVTVHLHPDDAERLNGVPFRRGTTIEPDMGVVRGSVHVETPHGLLVHDVENAVAAIGERISANLRSVEGLGPDSASAPHPDEKRRP